MKNSFLDVYNHINNIVSRLDLDDNILNTVANILSESLFSNILIIDHNSKIMFEKKVDDVNYFTNTFSNGVKYIDFQLNEQLKSIAENRINVKLDNFYIYLENRNEISKYFSAVIPVYVNFKRVASILLYRYLNKFEDNDVIIILFCSCIITMALKYLQSKLDLEEARNINSVKQAINLLSYSELEAILSVFNVLKNNEGLIIASKIADKFNIAPSIVGNAIRKFESAGLIEARSLGMKGTYIKVLNIELFKELAKLQK